MPRKADLALALALLVASFLPLVWMGETENAVCAEITVDGKLTRRIPLAAHGEESFSIETPWGANQIRVENGAVSVSGADCPDRICTRAAPISRPGEAIACVPHKLLIEIRGTN